MSDPKFAVGDIVFGYDDLRAAKVIEVEVDTGDSIFSGGHAYLIEYLTGKFVGPKHLMWAGEAALLAAEEL